MLAWIDLEMTGLDADRDVILEIAVLVTDDDLAIVAEGPDLVVHAPAEALDAMDAIVVKMHADSGLSKAVEASTVSVDEAAAAVLEFLRLHLPAPKTVPLCGNSIATDRRFLARYMPEVDNWFHYRSIDVSTVKELCRRWYPQAYKAAPTKAGGHRAMDDIRESVAELAYYRSAIFLPAQGPPTAPPTRHGRTHRPSDALGRTSTTPGRSPSPTAAGRRSTPRTPCRRSSTPCASATGTWRPTPTPRPTACWSPSTTASSTG